MKIGIFGGTFDPVHIGHLILAEQCRTQAHLDQVWFMPAAYPPHKSGPGLTRFEQRCEMLELATAGHPAFRVDRLEKSLPPPSYTSQTLRELKRLYPRDHFDLLMGSDGLPDLPGWHEPRHVIEQAGLIVVPRPGVLLWTGERLAAALGLQANQVRLQFAGCPFIEISSRELRRSIAEGMSIRYLVPRAVEEYIRDRKLYSSIPPAPLHRGENGNNPSLPLPLGGSE